MTGIAAQRRRNAPRAAALGLGAASALLAPLAAEVRVRRAIQPHTDRWRTRDQGGALSVARQLADVIGIDHYPRHALASVGPWSLYLDGGRSPWQRWRDAALLARAGAGGRPVIVTEGQAEPWEATTIPPDPQVGGMYSCLPERVIDNYNRCMCWGGAGRGLSAYLFWGAEYWLLRQRRGDDRHLRAFARILEEA